MKHVHYDLICAWAGGAEIEYFMNDSIWIKLEEPTWDIANKYRIKSKDKVCKLILGVGVGVYDLTYTIDSETKLLKYARVIGKPCPDAMQKALEEIIKYYGDKITMATIIAETALKVK